MKRTIKPSKTPSVIGEARRFSDDAIYLNEPKLASFKERLVFLGDLIDAVDYVDPLRVFDVGCASGEFVYYLNHRFPNCRSTGLDISSAMIAQAQKDIPESDFYVGSALDLANFAGNEFDVVTSSGILCIFDDIEEPLAHMLSCVRKGGAILIYTLINDDPVDVIMRYRRSDGAEAGEWEQGWNVFSKNTFENTLRRLNLDLTWEWHPFELSIPLQKRDDPMRTWTIQTEENKHQLINGACQLVKTQFLHITV